MATEGLPRTIWFVWLQGREDAPEIVRRCHASWVARNPGWDVRFLDERSLSAVTAIDYRATELGSQLPNHRANVLRLELLARHGGVWADATTFCTRPLEEWLLPRMASGFFAFANPTRTRLLATWLLAAEPGNPLVERLLDVVFDYWGRRTFRDYPRLEPWFARRLGSTAWGRGLWFGLLLRDVLRMRPYFALPYAFERLVRDDEVVRRIWEATPKLAADGAHGPKRAGLLSPLTPELRAEMDARAVPVYKLSWKLDGGAPPPGSVLDHILGLSDAPPPSRGDRAREAAAQP